MSTLPAEDNDEAPALRLQEMIAGYRISQAIYVAAKLGIADLLAERPSAATSWPGIPRRTRRRFTACCGRWRALACSARTPRGGGS